MSAFYDLASLVLVPSGYKASKVYAQKPLTTDGQLSFTRSTGATRVGPDGLIEKVRTNLALQSQNFSSATWLKPASVTYGESDPFGGTNAALVQFDASASSAMAQGNFSITSGVTYTISAWIKGVNLSGLRMVFANNQVIDVFPQVVNGSWVRIKATATATATGTFFAEFARANNTSAQSFYIYGAQYEVSDFGPTDYIATTSAAVSVGPVANVPRLDYAPTLGQSGVSCPRLLLEPQRTNLVTSSEQFNNWSFIGATANPNVSASPDGYQSADEVIGDGSSTNVRTYIGVSTSAGVNTFSVFLKSGNTDFAYVQFSGFGGITGTSFAFFDLANGTTPTSGATIQDYGNGWYRCSISATIDASDTSGNVGFSATPSTVSAPFPTAVDANGKYVLAWGAQLEAGAYATSYIPTLGAAVTRGADACSKTGISSLIGQQEGVVFVDFVYNAVTAGTSASNIINTERNTTASLFINRVPSTGFCNAGLFINGTTAASFNAGLITLGQRTKIAYAYKSGSSAIYINGVQIGTSAATFTIPDSLDDIHLNDVITYFSFQENVSFNQVLLFKTRLTNAQLAELTTL